MKILMVNRPKNLWIGGDYIQMEKTAEALERLGDKVEIIETPLISPAIRMREFDVVHTFNFPMIWAKYSIWAGAKWGKKNVCSMLYHDIDRYVPYDQQQIMADSLNALIFLADGEYDRFNKNLKADKDRVFFVPNGIDEYWFNKVIGKKIDREFVLTVGRLDGTKGQFELAIACKQLGLTLICVGERNDKNYAKLCEEAGAILTGSMEKEELIKMYACCQLFALNSKAEVMPLSVMEAMAQNKPVVLSNKCEYKFKNVIWTDTDIESVKKALKKALKYKKDTIDEVKGMTWDNVAKQLHDIYENI